jgi:hypothetical protein
VSDITQHRTGQGWVYCAVVLDVCSRRVVGWSIADHLHTELVLDALDMPGSLVEARMSALRPRLAVVRPSPAGVFDERGELAAERSGVRGAQVSLILGAVEPNRTVLSAGPPSRSSSLPTVILLPSWPPCR